MSICAWQFFDCWWDCGSGLYGDVMDARESGECFAPVAVPIVAANTGGCSGGRGRIEVATCNEGTTDVAPVDV